MSLEFMANTLNACSAFHCSPLATDLAILSSIKGNIRSLYTYNEFLIQFPHSENSSFLTIDPNVQVTLLGATLSFVCSDVHPRAER